MQSKASAGNLLGEIRNEGVLHELVDTNQFFHILQHPAVVHPITQQYYLIGKLPLKPTV